MAKPETTPALAPATPASPATATAPQPDKYHGAGGLYSIVNGERVLLSRTKTADEAAVTASSQA